MKNVHVEAGSCIRCGACAALCPGVFDVSGGKSRVLREPKPQEQLFALAARWICPMDAVRGSQDETVPNAEASVLYDELARGAEAVRWQSNAIPWDEIDATKAPPELRNTVREMAFSENATYSATQRFLESFYDDVDFSQWISVWFYEETRHPHVLIEWLRRVGEPTTDDFILKGRVSTPFMRSVIGTLTTNVISEVTAAQAYRHLARTSPEPVLGTIARFISGDEARHAASFFRFARKQLARETPEARLRERTRGLEVLQAWLGGGTAATHPVAQMIERFMGMDHGSVDLGFTAVRARVVRVVGLLLDLPLSREDEVPLMLRELLAQRRQ